MGWVTQNTFREGGVQQEVMENVTVQTPTGDMLVNQMRAGSLDAAVVYLSNTAGSGDFLDAVRIQGLDCSVATQPYAITPDSPNALTASRLFAQICSTDSQDSFMAEGFRWKLDTEPPIMTPNAVQQLETKTKLKRTRSDSFFLAASGISSCVPLIKQLLAADRCSPEGLQGCRHETGIQWHSGSPSVVHHRGLVIHLQLRWDTCCPATDSRALLIDTIVDIPIVLPPLVLGLSLRPFHLPVGNWELEAWLRDDVRFPSLSLPVVILAQFSVSCAFAVRTMRVTFDQSTHVRGFAARSAVRGDRPFCKLLCLNHGAE